MVRKDEARTTDLVGEDLRQRQRKDAELGAIVNFRLASDEAPENEELQTVRTHEKVGDEMEPISDS